MKNQDFELPDGEWHRRRGKVTFLAQGIIEGITQAAPSRSLFMQRIPVNKQIRLVLLDHDKTGELKCYKNILDATLNKTGPTTVQLGRGRKKVRSWISSVWKFFDTETSHSMLKQKQWEDWFLSTGLIPSDFQYEIFFDIDAHIPTVWVRPINK